MTLAADILERKNAAGKKKASKPEMVIDGGASIDVGGVVARTMTVTEASALFAQFDAEAKEADAKKGSVGTALKVVGVDALRRAEAEGKYYARALAGMVQVCRQNKYKPVDCASRDELIEALGLVEYAALVQEKAQIEFASVEVMRQFVDACKAAGVQVPGEVVETVTPRTTFAERKTQLLGALDGGKRALLDGLGGETTFSVMVKKEEF